MNMKLGDEHIQKGETHIWEKIDVKTTVAFSIPLDHY